MSVALAVRDADAVADAVVVDDDDDDDATVAVPSPFAAVAEDEGKEAAEVEETPTEVSMLAGT